MKLKTLFIALSILASSATHAIETTQTSDRAEKERIIAAISEICQLIDDSKEVHTHIAKSPAFVWYAAQTGIRGHFNSEQRKAIAPAFSCGGLSIVVDDKRANRILAGI